MSDHDRGPDLQQYFEDRAEYYSNIDDIQKLISDELNEFVQKNLDAFENKAEFINSESNQFERHHTGFFAVAISFIIAGLLGELPLLTDTDATKFFFAISIIAAIVAAGLLFIEFVIVRKFHNRWQTKNQSIIKYISQGEWTSPSQLSEWIAAEQGEGRISQHSASWVVRLEIVLVSTSLIALALWVVEKVYNPNFIPCI